MSGKNCYLFFSGYYAAVKVSQILTGHQIDNRVVRAPVHMRNSSQFRGIDRCGGRRQDNGAPRRIEDRSGEKGVWGKEKDMI